MTSIQILTNRLQKELRDLDRDPPPGITCYPKEDNITELEAYIKGPPDSPYEKGLFKLSIQIPDRYPFEPPQMKFLTRIYHPNIDDSGRICADILKTGEHGSWKPAINLSTALVSLQQLLASPNPDDPLDADIAKEYQREFDTFERNAREFTTRFANEESVLNNEQDVGDDIKLDANKQQEVTLEQEEEEKIKQLEKKPKLGLSLSKRKGVASSQSTSSSSSQANSQVVLHSSKSKNVSLKRIPETELEKATKVVKMYEEGSSKSVNISIKEMNIVKKTEKVEKLKIQEQVKTIVEDADMISNLVEAKTDQDTELNSISSQTRTKKPSSNDEKDSQQYSPKRKRLMDNGEGEEPAIVKKYQHSMINLSSQKLRLLSSSQLPSQKAKESSSQQILNKSTPNKATETSSTYFSQPIFIKSHSDNRKEKDLKRDNITTRPLVSQEVINLMSDSEEEEVDDDGDGDGGYSSRSSQQQSTLHSLQLSKKLSRPKLSLSKSKK